jgi:hypothetical protein
MPGNTRKKDKCALFWEITGNLGGTAGLNGEFLLTATVFRRRVRWTFGKVASWASDRFRIGPCKQDADMRSLPSSRIEDTLKSQGTTLCGKQYGDPAM